MLGGNIGNRVDYLCRSVDLLRRETGKVLGMSAIYESEPWGFEHSDWFLNRAVVLKTNLSPHELLKSIQRIEQAMGRIRLGNTYQARTMDIDILFYGDLVIETPELSIPHPRIAGRMFVLKPMAELAPDLMHPVLHRTMRDLAEHCPDKSKVRKYPGDVD